MPFSMAANQLQVASPGAPPSSGHAFMIHPILRQGHRAATALTAYGRAFGALDSRHGDPSRQGIDGEWLAPFFVSGLFPAEQRAVIMYILRAFARVSDEDGIAFLEQNQNKLSRQGNMVNHIPPGRSG